MQSAETVSIIMPCYNCEVYVKKTLDSIFSQSFIDFKLYCVNDGSHDTTLQILQNYQESYPDKMVVLNQANQGQTVAKNNAIAVSNGTYIALVDSDDVWVQDKLERQVMVFEKYSDIGLCYTNGQYMDSMGHVMQNIGVEPDLNGACLNRLLKGNAIVASSVMFKRDLVSKRPFDEELSACENWELWIRISQISNFKCLDLPLVYYRRHENNQSLNLNKMRRNRLLVIQKYAKYLENTLDDIHSISQQAIFHTYLNFAKDAIWRFDLKLARENVLQAIKMNPFSMQCYPLLFKTLMGAHVLRLIRRGA